MDKEHRERSDPKSIVHAAADHMGLDVAGGFLLYRSDAACQLTDFLHFPKQPSQINVQEHKFGMQLYSRRLLGFI